MDERGGAVGVEMTLLWGVVALLTMAVVQVALLFFGGQLALSAAEDGVHTGGGYGVGSAAVAQRAAEAFLKRAGGTTLSGATVSATVDVAAGLIRVRVEGTAPSLLPGVPIRVSREAVAGLERITP